MQHNRFQWRIKINVEVHEYQTANDVSKWPSKWKYVKSALGRNIAIIFCYTLDLDLNFSTR